IQELEDLLHDGFRRSRRLHRRSASLRLGPSGQHQARSVRDVRRTADQDAVRGSWRSCRAVDGVRLRLEPSPDRAIAVAQGTGDVPGLSTHAGAGQLYPEPGHERAQETKECPGTVARALWEDLG